MYLSIEPLYIQGYIRTTIHGIIALGPKAAALLDDPFSALHMYLRILGFCAEGTTSLQCPFLREVSEDEQGRYIACVVMSLVWWGDRSSVSIYVWVGGCEVVGIRA